MAAIPKISHKLWAAKICKKVHIFHEFERVNKKPYTTCVLLIYSKLGDSFNSHQVLSRGYGWANPRNTSQPTFFLFFFFFALAYSWGLCKRTPLLIDML